MIIVLIHFVGRWFLSLSLSLATRFVTFRSNVTLSGRFVRGIRDPVVFLNNTLTVRVEHGVYAWKVRDETETALIGRRSKRTKESRTTKWRRNFKEISRGILCLYLPPYAQNQWKIFTVSPNKFFRDTEIISSTFVKASVPLIPRVLDRFFVPALVCRIGLIHSLVTSARKHVRPPRAITISMIFIEMEIHRDNGGRDCENRRHRGSSA